MRSRPVLPRDASLLHWGVLAVLCAALLLPQLLVQLAAIPHFCLFEYVSGLDCPGCGVTTALLQLAKGDPAAAWETHPVAVLLPFYLFFSAVLTHRSPLGPQRYAAMRILDYGFLSSLAVFWIISTLIPHLR
jgi:hypothetical protein